VSLSSKKESFNFKVFEETTDFISEGKLSQWRLRHYPNIWLQEIEILHSIFNLLTFHLSIIYVIMTTLSNGNKIVWPSQNLIAINMEEKNKELEREEEKQEFAESTTDKEDQEVKTENETVEETEDANR
jgi:hypothetical protein